MYSLPVTESATHTIVVFGCGVADIGAWDWQLDPELDRRGGNTLIRVAHFVEAILKAIKVDIDRP